MSNLVKIHDKDLQIKDFHDQRVVTFKDIDRLHERVEGTAKRNFNDNRNHFVENVDYFSIKKSEVGTDFVLSFGFDKFAANGILITESGYLMLVKSLTDDLAWKVQRELVNNYFRFKKLKQLTPMDQLRLQYQVLEEHQEKISSIETKVTNLENNMTIDYGQQLVLQELAKARAIQEMGGKESYCYKDKSLRSKVFSRVWKDFKDYLAVNSYRNTPKKDFDKAKEYLKEWKAQGKLLREIEEFNCQVAITEVACAK